MVSRFLDKVKFLLREQELFDLRFSQDLPNEALEHGDAVMLGEAEATWPDVLAAHARGALRRRYAQDGPTDMARIKAVSEHHIPPSAYGGFWSASSRGGARCNAPSAWCTSSSLASSTGRWAA